MGRRCVAPYPTRPLEHSHSRAKSTRTVRVHCEHILVWTECTGRTRRSGRSVYTGNPTRTVRERYARRVKLSVCTRPNLTMTYKLNKQNFTNLLILKWIFVSHNYLLQHYFDNVISLVDSSSFSARTPWFSVGEFRFSQKFSNTNLYFVLLLIHPFVHFWFLHTSRLIANLHAY